MLGEVLGDYQSFLQGFMNIRDEQVRSTVEGEIADGLLWLEPWLALNPSFESGGIGALVMRGYCILGPAPSSGIAPRPI